ncbi:MAG: YIP1 family protein [Promethearchaeota archaeon]
MSTKKFCENCGTPLPADQSADFCGNCGAPIRGATPAPGAGVGAPTYQDTRLAVQAALFPEEQPTSSFPQRFVKVLTSPEEGMSMITRAPDYLGPFLIAFIIGIFVTISGLITASRTQYNIIGDMGVPGFDVSSLEPIMNAAGFFGSFIGIIDPIIGLLIWGVIFWLLMAAFSNLNSSDRTFKRSISIVGFASIPLILGGIINVVYSFFYYPETVITLDYDKLFAGSLDYLQITGGNYISWPLEIVSFLLLLWTVFLVYKGLQTLEVSSDKRLIICAVYIVLGLLHLGFVLFDAFFLSPLLPF